MIETFPDAMLYLASVGHAPNAVSSEHVVAASVTPDSYYLAAEGPGTKGLMDWIKANALPLIVLACACVAGLGALRQNASKVITIGALIVVVLVIAGIAGSAATQQTIQQWALGLFGL